MAAVIKTHKILIFGIIMLVLGAIVISSLIILRPSKPQEVIFESPIGSTITQIVPADKLVSMMVTPASEQWWGILDQYTPTFNIDDINYASIPGKEVNLGWSVSFSNEEKTDTSFGLNTVCIEYATAAEAEKTLAYVSANSTGSLQAFQVENIVAIIPTWAFSDRDFLIEDFNREVAETVALDESSWLINFDNWSSMNQKYYSEAVNNISGNTLTNLGFTPVSGATWSGQSTDGITWNGEFPDKMWSYDNVDTVKLQADLESTKEYIPFSPELEGVNPEDYPQGEGDIAGIVIPHQSLILEYLSISTKDNVFGQVTGADGSIVNQEKTAEDKVVTLSTDPNAWIALMSDRLDAPPLFKFSKMDFVFSKTSNEMDIVLTKAVWADEL